MNYPTEVVDPSAFTNNVWRYLTPSMVEQQKLISKGECPHNQGFAYQGRFRGDIERYTCKICSKSFLD